MRKMIGFHKEVEEVSEHIEVSDIDHTKVAAQILQQAGYQKSIQIVKEYMNPYLWPYIRGEKRDQWLLDKLHKIRHKYLD